MRGNGEVTDNAAARVAGEGKSYERPQRKGGWGTPGHLVHHHHGKKAEVVKNLADPRARSENAVPTCEQLHRT